MNVYVVMQPNAALMQHVPIWLEALRANAILDILVTEKFAMVSTVDKVKSMLFSLSR